MEMKGCTETHRRLLAFIDRSNIGNAKIDGIVDDLNLTGDKFNVALVVFYILYILIDIPSNLVVKRIGAGYACCSLVVVASSIWI